MLSLMTRTPDAGLSCPVASEHPVSIAPRSRAQKTAGPAVGTVAGLNTARLTTAGLITAGPSTVEPASPLLTPFAQVAFGARSTDLPGSCPRGAPG